MHTWYTLCVLILHCINYKLLGSENVGAEGSDDHGEGSGDLGDEIPEGKSHTHTHTLLLCTYFITLGSKAADDGVQIKSSGDLEESAGDNDPVNKDVEDLYDVGSSGDFETLGGKL